MARDPSSLVCILINSQSIQCTSWTFGVCPKDSKLTQSEKITSSVTPKQNLEVSSNSSDPCAYKADKKRPMSSGKSLNRVRRFPCFLLFAFSFFFLVVVVVYRTYDEGNRKVRRSFEFKFIKQRRETLRREIKNALSKLHLSDGRLGFSLLTATVINFSSESNSEICGESCK